MDRLQVSALIIGSAVLAASVGVIAWREIRAEPEAAYLRSWRDVAGLVFTLAGVGALLVVVWMAR